MKGIRHNMLDGGANILEDKVNAMIRQSAPRRGKSSFVLILIANMDLIVTGEAMHKG